MKKFILLIALLINVNNAFAIDVKAKSYILKDLNTGKILMSKNQDEYLPPASTTKLMTLYLLFEEIKNKKVKLSDKITISKTASRKGGSKMFLTPGSKIRVVDLIKGIAVSSGNDASIAIAEYIAGSEKEFVKKMNAKAREMGMKKTNFVNATGWDNKGHVSTAHDLSVLAENIIKDFPEFYKVFRLKSFKHNGIRQYNKNTLIGQMGVDGLKTGHVGSIGYNIISSAKQNQLRYLVVLLGAKTKTLRESETKKLYEYAYSKYKNVKLLSKDEVLAQPFVYLGKSKFIEAGVKEDVFINLTQKEFDNLDAQIEYKPIINAPVYYGDVVGRLKVTFSDDSIPMYYDLVAKSSSEEKLMFERLDAMLDYKFNKEKYLKLLETEKD